MLIMIMTVKEFAVGEAFYYYLVYCGFQSIFVNCWSVGVGAGYKILLRRDATNHLRDHSVSSTRHCECGRATGGYFAYSFRQILRST